MNLDIQIYTLDYFLKQFIDLIKAINVTILQTFLTYFPVFTIRIISFENLIQSFPFGHYTIYNITRDFLTTLHVYHSPEFHHFPIR